MVEGSADGNGNPTACDIPVFDEPSGRRVVAIASAVDIERARQALVDARADAIVVQRQKG